MRKFEKLLNMFSKKIMCFMWHEKTKETMQTNKKQRHVRPIERHVHVQCLALEILGSNITSLYLFSPSRAWPSK